MENIQLLHQELNARGDEQVREVVAVDLKKRVLTAGMLDLQKSHCWNFRSAKRVSLSLIALIRSDLQTSIWNWNWIDTCTRDKNMVICARDKKKDGDTCTREGMMRR